MDDERVDALAKEFIGASARRRISLLRELPEDDRIAMVRRTAALGYEPAKACYPDVAVTEVYKPEAPQEIDA